MSQSLPRTRQEALELGSRHYFTGKPCKHGHVEKRFSQRGTCMGCSRSIALDVYRRDPALAISKVRKWESENPDRRKYHRRKGVAQHRAAKLQRTPTWANLEAIKVIYENCPPGHDVDHVIPLQGKKVSGLHVVANLQYLTVSDNRSKSNKYAD